MSEPSTPATIDPPKMSRTTTREKLRCCTVVWLVLPTILPSRTLLSRRIARTSEVITTKRRSRSNANATMDTATRKIGVAMSRSSPSAMMACGRNTSNPAHTWPNVCGKERSLFTDKPPGRSGSMSKPIKMILALSMTPPCKTHPISRAVNSLLSEARFWRRSGRLSSECPSCFGVVTRDWWEVPSFIALLSFASIAYVTMLSSSSPV